MKNAYICSQRALTPLGLYEGQDVFSGDKNKFWSSENSPSGDTSCPSRTEGRSRSGVASPNVQPITAFRSEKVHLTRGFFLRDEAH